METWRKSFRRLLVAASADIFIRGKTSEDGPYFLPPDKKADAALGPAALPEIRPPGPFRPCKGFSVSLRLAGISMTGGETLILMKDQILQA